MFLEISSAVYSFSMVFQLITRRTVMNVGVVGMHTIVPDVCRRHNTLVSTTRFLLTASYPRTGSQFSVAAPPIVSSICVPDDKQTLH
jgi:hypothetical protein